MLMLLLTTIMCVLPPNSVVITFDQTAPVLQLTQLTMFVEAGTQWIDPGAMMFDNYFGNLTKDIVVTGTVDTSKLGQYLITYSGQDPCGNVAIPQVRTIIVRDTTPPTINLVGGDTLNLKRAWAVYKDPGYAATDLVDGSCPVTVKGSVLPLLFTGTYTLTYSATDKSGNTASKIRKVIVK